MANRFHIIIAVAVVGLAFILWPSEAGDEVALEPSIEKHDYFIDMENNESYITSIGASQPTRTGLRRFRKPH